MAKRKIDWSVESRLDLYDILEFYVTRNGTTSYSRKLLARINKNVKLLSKNPLIGTQTDYESVRALITGDYQIVYEIFDQLILIIMVWDSRRDPEDKNIGQRIKTLTGHNMRS
jgi:plasmid stabilization system protein ParE